MFPIRDDNPQIYLPFATWTIVGLNVAAWVILQGFGTEPVLTQSVCNLGLIPGDLLGSADVSQLPPDFPCHIDGHGSWLTLLTSMFSHGSWMHIIGNMWFLWIFGNNVEDAMGSPRFVIFYLLCGLAAALLQTALNPTSPMPMVGASGAIGGVMGAYVVLYPRVHVHMLIFLGFYITTVAVPAIAMLGYWIVVQLLGAVMADNTTGGVAFWAHVGGFGAGAMLVMLFKDERRLSRHPYRGWRQESPPTRLWHKVGSRRNRRF